MTLTAGMVTQKIILSFTSTSQDNCSRPAILVLCVMYSCLRYHWWKCTTARRTYTYDLLVSLQNLPSFHKDFLIVLGVWDFFFQIHLKAVELSELLLVRSYTGSSSETKISTQRSSWLPKEARCSQATHTTTQLLCVYVCKYMTHLRNVSSRKSHSVQCSCFCCKTPLTAYRSSTVRYRVRTEKLCLILYVNRLLPKNGTEMLCLKNGIGASSF